MEDEGWVAKSKAHVVRNKKLYIGIGIGIIVTAVGVKTGPTIINSFNINYKSVNVVKTELVRRGHPGNIIRCINTGEVFASQNRAAEALKISAGDLSKHLNGQRDHVKGLIFEAIGEATA